MGQAPRQALAPEAAALQQDYWRVRRQTQALVAPLSVDDCNVQTMPDVSPAKWHLAHTTWFFETFLLRPHLAGYEPAHPQYEYLFNSYYEAVGERHPRPQRGQLSRPTLEEVHSYRERVDGGMQTLLCSEPSAELCRLIRLGLEHEQQHQELILTDIKHVLGSNPLRPAYHPRPTPPGVGEAPEQHWLSQPEGLYEIGHDDDGFAFDNEGPRHRQWLQAYALASRPVTEGEWADFIADSGYETAGLWLSDGWAWVQQNQARAPLYWFADEHAGWQRYTLAGPAPIDPARPVCHINFYEATAYAAWAGARLPSEAEWEVLAASRPIAGDFQQAGAYHPAALGAAHPGQGSDFFYGGVWEWTASSYAPYPGFQPPAGALGEYNAKFMASQLVLRGGSCASPREHLRASYRNFFYPPQQWQFSGLRLARDD